jgi:hypothetical protein
MEDVQRRLDALLHSTPENRALLRAGAWAAPMRDSHERGRADRFALRVAGIVAVFVLAGFAFRGLIALETFGMAALAGGVAFFAAGAVETVRMRFLGPRTAPPVLTLEGDATVLRHWGLNQDGENVLCANLIVGEGEPIRLPREFGELVIEGRVRAFVWVRREKEVRGSGEFTFRTLVGVDSFPDTRLDRRPPGRPRPPGSTRPAPRTDANA